MLKQYARRFNPRYWSNDELRLAASHFPHGARVINVSGWHDQDKEGGVYRGYFSKPTIYHISNYDGDHARGTNTPTDIKVNLSQPLPREYEAAYDIAFSHTVLEHLENPHFGFEQIARLTRDMIITVVPFKQKLHFENGMFGDYFRFTPFTMRRWHEQNGFTILYESYTPRPSLDVYLFYVGTKNPTKYSGYPRRVAEINLLNQQVGSYSAYDLARNIAIRFITKYLS